MKPEAKAIIIAELRTLIMERTRDQFGRAWAGDLASFVAGDVAASIERRLEDVAEMTVTKDIDEQTIHARLQKAWWDSMKVAKAAEDDYKGWAYFVRKMNAAFTRNLF